MKRDCMRLSEALTSLTIDSTVLAKPKRNISLSQVRMLTQSDVDLLQKDKQDALDTRCQLFDNMDIRKIIAQKVTLKMNWQA